MNHNEFNSEDRIRAAFQQKDWNEIKSHDSWSVLKSWLNLLMAMKQWAA
jgi:hypothetical protein